MAKWHGQIGFAEEVELRPGVFTNKIVPRDYYGEVTRNNYRSQSSGNIIDNVKIDNQISIVADSYANSHFGYMKWIDFNGMRLKISAIEVKRPRLLISMGDLWNENTDR